MTIPWKGKGGGATRARSATQDYLCIKLSLHNLGLCHMDGPRRTLKNVADPLVASAQQNDPSG